MSNELETLKESLDRQQQYSRRNCILIHETSKQKGEHTDEQTLKMIREELLWIFQRKVSVDTNLMFQYKLLNNISYF